MLKSFRSTLSRSKGFRLDNQKYRTMYLHKAPKNSGNYRAVDLRSDTFSKPSAAMRKAIFDAEVGDDVYGEDPTVNELERKAAKLFGKESALFVTSGTMSNLIAVMAHCDRRGAELIVGDQAHIYIYEQGGAAQLGGIHTRSIVNKDDGTFDIDDLNMKIRIDDLHHPITSLICIENTHNMCGGKVLPLEWLDKLGKRARELNLPIHMDGARVFNAAVHLKVPVSRVVQDCASVSVCLSKGLGAPVGSVLLGTTEFINKGRRLRKALGGAMRQAGVLAAAGIYSFDHMIDRLADDHRRTTKVAKAISDMNSKAMWVDLENLHTNILMVHLDPKKLTSVQLTDRMSEVTDSEAASLGNKATVVQISPKTDDCVRLVLYCDISDEDVDAVIEKLKVINSEVS